MDKYIRNTVKYENVNNLVLEVKNKLRVYFDSNKVDESIFPARIRHCMSKIRDDHRPLKWEIVEIKNNKGKLPTDFDKLCIALGCFKGEIVTERPGIHTKEYHVCELDLCQSKCDVCHDECGNMFQIVQRTESITKSYRKFELLSVSKHSRPYCDSECFNFNASSADEITITDGTIHTNFDEGLVYIEYISSLVEDAGYMVPVNPTIQEWIKADLIHEVLQTLYWNGEPDLVQRYQDAKRDLHIKAENARVLYKRSEFQDFYSMSNNLIRRWNYVRNNIYNENIHGESSYRYPLTGRRYD